MIGKALLALALASASVPVASGTIDSGMPPERFRGNTASIVVFTDRAGIDEACGLAPPGYIILACRRELQNGAPILFMPNPCLMGETDAYAKLLCHEMGHVNGWSGNHEQ